MDHKNLENICRTKRLNSRWARWALSFTWFTFTMSYHLGSRNGKLMPCLGSLRLKTDLGMQLPSCRGTAWSRQSPRMSRRRSRTPKVVHLGVLGPLQSRVQLGHGSQLRFHTEVSRTLSLITQHFWWPSFPEDVCKFISACPVSAFSTYFRPTDYTVTLFSYKAGFLSQVCLCQRIR